MPSSCMFIVKRLESQINYEKFEDTKRVITSVIDHIRTDNAMAKRKRTKIYETPTKNRR